MTKKRMTEILLLAAKEHNCKRGVCFTLHYLLVNRKISREEKQQIIRYLLTYFRAEEGVRLYWLSKNNSRDGYRHRKNILLDAAARVQVYGVRS